MPYKFDKELHQLIVEVRGMNLEGSPFHAAQTLWILSFGSSGSFDQLLGNGLYPTGTNMACWI